MRQFAGSGVRLWNLSREVKVVYTAFLVCSLLAFLSSFLIARDMVGGRGAAAYYAGEQGTAPAMDHGGPRMELPEEPTRIDLSMPYRKLLEVAHFHLFTVPVFLLIVTHLFVLTGVGSTAKLMWILAAWLGSLAHIGAPFLVRYGGTSFAWCFMASGILMAVPLVVVTVSPAVAMWRSPPLRTD
jgi:hypothetical protein